MVFDGKTLADFPADIRRFIGSFDAIDLATKLVASCAGSGDGNVTSSVLALIRRAGSGEQPLDQLPAAIASLLGCDEATARQAATEIVIERVLPVADAVGLDAVGALSAWNVDPAMYRDVRPILVTDGRPSADEAVSSRSGAGFSDPILQHRLELIVSSFRDGVRTKEQAMAVLMRPIKTGGLELKEQEAGDVLALVGTVVEGAKVAGGDVENVDEASSVSTPPAVTAKPSPSPTSTGATGAKVDSFTKEDEAEIASVAEQKKEVIATPSLITDTKAAADKIVADAKLAFATGELRTRFDHIIDARLRDVRDGFETRARLEDSAEKGGVGLSGAQLVAVMEMVEEMDAMHHKALALQMAEKKEAHAAQKVERAQQAEATNAQEAVVMAKRYAELTGKAPTELVAPVVPSRPTAMPPAEAVKRREEQIDTSKVKAAIEAAKAGAPVVTPVLSESSIPTTASGRPKVEDIRFERKLAGPVEELRLLTLVDFRRLSKDPKQATLKIQDKVELVGQDGYEQRIAAIRAWRESPLSREYVAVSREALLAGTSIAKVLADKRADGQDVLTDDELKAIVDLNGILRF